MTPGKTLGCRYNKLMRHHLSPEWSIDVTRAYQRRREDDHIIFWRKGATILITVFAYTGEKNRQILLANLKARAEAEKLEVITDLDGDLERFGYLKTEDIQPGHKRLALHAFTTAPHGCLQTSFYLDDSDELREPLRIWQSVSYHMEA